MNTFKFILLTTTLAILGFLFLPYSTEPLAIFVILAGSPLSVAGLLTIIDSITMSKKTIST